MTTNNSINRRTDLLNVSPSGTGAGETGEVRFQELAANGTDYVALKAADSTATQTYTLPDAYPASNGQVLSAQTDGTMSWAAAATGGVSGPVSTTQDALVRWDGTDGTAVADSTITLDGSGNMSGVVSVSSSASVTVEADSLDVVNGNDSTAGAELRLYEASDNGSDYIGVKPPASLVSSYTYTLPSAYPSSSGQVLSSTTTGTMSWVTAGGGGGGSGDWEEVASQTVSDSTYVDFIISNSTLIGYLRFALISTPGSTFIDKLQGYSESTASWMASYSGRILTNNNSNSWSSVSPPSEVAITGNLVWSGPSQQNYIYIIGDSVRYFKDFYPSGHRVISMEQWGGNVSVPGGFRFYHSGSNCTGTYTLLGERRLDA